jgi:hypothetical protein
MRQNIAQFSAGSTAVMATLLAVHALIGHSPARAETFDTRFAAVEPAPKGDRLGTPAQASGSTVVFYSDPRAGLTIATKIAGAKKNEEKNESSNKTREAPAGNAQQEKQQQKKKLLVGCEPSFSPVTTPSMANVTGRCIAAKDSTIKVAAR